MARETKNRYIEAVGRRKAAVARVRIFPAKENSVTVNEKPLEDFFKVNDLQKDVMLPLREESVTSHFSVSAKVSGGGIASQAEAIRLGIARALVKFDEELRGVLKREGYLTRDPRKKERRKFGLKKARKAPQWSKR